MVSGKVIVLSALAAGTVAAGAAAFFMHRRRSRSAKKDKKKKRVKKTKPVVDLPDNDSLAEAIVRSMEVLQTTADPCRPEEKRLMQWCSLIDVDKYTARTRLLAAQWVVLYQTVQTLINPGQDDQRYLMTEMINSMKLAWKMLMCSPGTAEEQQAVDILKLDVAQRLRDPEKLVPVYERMMERAESLSLEEVLVMFTTAPLLGRWADTKRLGGILESKKRSLEEFHMAAMNRPELPDYEMLYRIASSKEKLEDSSVDNLKWSAYAVKQFRIRLRDVESRDASQAESVRSNMATDWENVPVGDETRLYRHGGIGQMLSASNVKLSMVGPWIGDRLHVEGYADMPTEGGTTVRQREVYDVELDASTNMYTGTYKLHQSPTAPGSDGDLSVVFDLEISLEEDSSFF